MSNVNYLRPNVTQELCKTKVTWYVGEEDIYYLSIKVFIIVIIILLLPLCNQVLCNCAVLERLPFDHDYYNFNKQKTI